MCFKIVRTLININQDSLEIFDAKELKKIKLRVKRFSRIGFQNLEIKFDQPINNFKFLLLLDFSFLNILVNPFCPRI